MKKPVIINNLGFLYVEWYNDVGIVACQDIITNEYKFYIKDISGNIDNTEMQDITNIVEWGSKFNYEAGCVLFKRLDGKPFKETHAEHFI